MIDWLFEVDLWPKRRDCGTWSGPLIEVHRWCGMIIAISYLVMPFLSTMLFQRWVRYWAVPRHMSMGVLLFGLFIVTCGVTHVTGDWLMFDHPAYRLHGMALVVCATASLSCALWMFMELTIWKPRILPSRRS